MARKNKMIQANLLKNSTAAYFAAVEIHNKPNILYRYETVTLLMMNAWELAHKAYIRKHIKKKSIFEIILFFIIMLLLIAFCFVKFMEFNYKISKGNRNLFYVTMVNKTVPIIETVHFDNTAMVENQFTLKNMINFFFDFSIDNPKSIIGKEFIGISMVDKDNISKDSGIKGFASDSIGGSRLSR